MRMPGHWLLAQMGKRVLRPGGIELTSQMLAGLEVGTDDDVVEFAPGLGVTARAALERRPQSYIGIEWDERAAEQVQQALSDAIHVGARPLTSGEWRSSSSAGSRPGISASASTSSFSGP